MLCCCTYSDTRILIVWSYHRQYHIPGTWYQVHDKDLYHQPPATTWNSHCQYFSDPSTKLNVSPRTWEFIQSVVKAPLRKPQWIHTFRYEKIAKQAVRTPTASKKRGSRGIDPAGQPSSSSTRIFYLFEERTVRCFFFHSPIVYELVYFSKNTTLCAAVCSVPPLSPRPLAFKKKTTRTTYVRTVF